MLLEVLICLVLLVMISGVLIRTFVNFQGLTAKLHYRNTAYNLMRDAMEFGEADIVLSNCAYTYAYNPAKDAYESECTTCSSSLPECSSTKFAEDCCIDPFKFLEDIKARKLVPEQHPNSVKIRYWSTVSQSMPDGTKLPCDESGTACRQYFTIHVGAEWTDRGKQNTVELSSAPIAYGMTQGLSLRLKEFWEE